MSLLKLILIIWISGYWIYKITKMIIVERRESKLLMINALPKTIVKSLEELYRFLFDDAEKPKKRDSLK